MDLERNEIERTDFAQARRGYDPEEVDRHLAEIAESVNELKRAASQAQGRDEPSGTGGLASAAAEQVRVIVDAAERSAAEIESSARAEADRVTRDAKRQAEEDRDAAHAEAHSTRTEATAAAQQTRERAESDAAAHVSKVEEATSEMRRRADTVQSDLGGLVDELRTTINSVVESVRTNAGSLESELEGIRSGLADVRDAAPVAEPVQMPPRRDEPAVEPEAAEEVDSDTEGSAVDSEAEQAEPLTAHEEDAEPIETAADPDEEAASEESAVEEPVVKGDSDAADEPEVEVAVAEAEVVEESGGGSGDGSEGARLIALNMALNGTPRDETSRYLEENFDLADRETILDEVYARVGG